MRNDRCVLAVCAFVLFGIVVVAVAVPAAGQLSSNSYPPTPPLTHVHEWTLALGGAVIGSFFGPIAEYVDNKLWSWFPVARIRRDQKVFQADTDAKLNGLEAKLDNITELLRQLHATRSAEQPEEIVTAAAEIAKPANDATMPPDP